MRLGATVPNFRANTTLGPIDFYDYVGDSDLARLHVYMAKVLHNVGTCMASKATLLNMENKWCVLFSHPADFTPVCTTELGRIAVHAQHFRKRNTKLLAHSCDSLSKHNDWVADIKSYCLDIPGDFPYPIIGDETRELAVMLDMIDEEQKDEPAAAQTVRALYIVDPGKRLRLSMHYPQSTGRNVDEILRVIDSLQLTDQNKHIATPANWVPGEKVMILPSVPDSELLKLFPNGVDKVSMPSGVTYIRTTVNY